MQEHVAERVVSRLTEVSIDSGDTKATITIVDYNELALDTVTVTIGGTAHVLTEGTDWNRGASNAAAATNLAAAINALTGVSASASAAVVTITAPENITSLAVSDAVNMTLVDSSLTTIYDPIKNWEVDKWKDAVIEVEVDGTHYYRTVASNTATTLTMGTLPAGHPVTPGAHYNIRWSVRSADISDRVARLLGVIILAAGSAIIGSVKDEFGGNAYSKTQTLTDDNATRLETTTKKLRDCVMIISDHPLLFGETGVEVYPLAVGDKLGFTKIDISTLYFKNAGAGNNGTVTILGVEE